MSKPDCDGNELITLPLSEVRALVFAARTTGGTAGRDEQLCAACEAVERRLPGLASEEQS